MSIDYKEIEQKYRNRLKNLEEKAQKTSLGKPKEDQGNDLINKGRRKRRIPFDKSPKQEREELKEKIISFNNNFFFGPAEEAIKLNREGIIMAHQGKHEEALDKFYDAIDYFRHPVFFVNLAKSQLELNNHHGNAIVALFNYIDKYKDQYDYYSQKIQEFLKFEEDQNEELIRGTWGNQHFTVYLDEEETVYKTVFEGEFPDLSLDLPYRTPLCLDLERKDKDIINYADYNYIYEWEDPFKATRFFELKVPLQIWRSFSEEFSGTLIDLSKNGKYNFLFQPEDLFDEELMRVYQPVEDNETYRNRLHTLCSIVTIELKNHKVPDLYNLFKKVIKPYLPEELSPDEEELIQMDDRYNNPNYEKEVEMMHYMEQYNLYYSPDEEQYGIISGFLFNLEKKELNPFLNLENQGYQHGKEKYKTFFPELFPDILKIEDSHLILRQRLTAVIDEIKSQTLRETITIEIQDIFDLIDNKPKSTLQHFRKSIELLVYSVYFKVLHTDVSDNESLYNVIRQLNNNFQVAANINIYLDDIRLKANKHLHGEKSRHLLKFSPKDFTVDEAYNLLEKLYVICEGLIHTYDL